MHKYKYKLILYFQCCRFIWNNY